MATEQHGNSLWPYKRSGCYKLAILSDKASLEDQVGKQMLI